MKRTLRGAIKGSLSGPALAGILAVASLSGCYQTLPPPGLSHTDPDPPITIPIRQYRTVGDSAEGRPIMAHVLGRGPEVIMVLGGIHGDETAGVQLVRYFSDYLNQYSEKAEGKTIVLVPVVNPDGRVANTRHNSRGVDLNRNFPASNRVESVESGPAGLSEPESTIVWRLIRQYNPARIISVHQPLACIDYDGPARDLAERMAEVCNLPVKKLGARPGSLGAYAGERLGIPIVTLELRETDLDTSTEVLWDMYGRALLAAIE